MPRKPQPKKETHLIDVNGSSIKVTFYPPEGRRKSWFVYWNGLIASKSTGQSDKAKAIEAVKAMLNNDGSAPTIKDVLLTDDEFKQIQHAYFAERAIKSGAKRAQKTESDCMEAIDAFMQITGLSPISKATPDDCAAFQRKALTLPTNWRKQYPKSKKTEKTLSPNTVAKWCRSLQAAFERATKTAGKKRVLGVVPLFKMLLENPWRETKIIEGPKRPIRQFDEDKLLSFLTFLETDWAKVPIAATAAKIFLWSASRKEEVTGLTWDALKCVDGEYHFAIVGKAGVERWLRIPEAVYNELVAFRTESPFVFAAYTKQIREANADNIGCLKKIRTDFLPQNFGRWFYERVKQWSRKHSDGKDYVHIFRKTSLQYARRGEDINLRVAEDARVSERVMTTSYVEETPEELRARSNRTFERIAASLPTKIAFKYGHHVDHRTLLERQLQEAVANKDWEKVRQFSGELTGDREVDRNLSALEGSGKSFLQCGLRLDSVPDL